MNATLRRIEYGVFGLLLWGTLGATSGCVVHPTGQHGPACAAIEAATNIDLAPTRLELLNKIAHRSHLSEHEQKYLVNAIIWGDLGGEQSKPLVVLIKNPCCTEGTRDYIAKQLRFVTYSSERKAVAEALNAEDKDSATTKPKPSPASKPSS